MYKIVAMRKTHIQKFLNYLDEHIAESGQPGKLVYFPISKSDKDLIANVKEAIVKGQERRVFSAGWRRAWLALDADGNICGHIDLRSYPQRHTEHRVLLGMGVHEKHRKNGLGKQLMDCVEQWCLTKEEIEYIDLQVLAHNVPALALYKNRGYIENARQEDFFRFDKQSFSTISMFKKIR